MTSLYPGAIDGYSQMRVIRNRIDSIIAEDHNTKRDAIIAIEQTLGINPQGPFGTVVARLNDGYSNIESHVRGGLPRHEDTVITSVSRSGTYHSLSVGTVGSQITQLLADINHILYGGSGATTFADGYALPASGLRGAVTNIVGQVGGATGATKIGATAFSSGQFDVTGATVQAQIASLGASLNEGATFRRRVFDSFISEGLTVTNGTGVNAVVASGLLMSNGRIYNLSVGQTVTVPVLAGTYYIYASVLDETITLGATTSAATATSDEETTTVLLHKIVHNGTAWTSDLDIRRFGMLDNDKNVYVVGDGLTDGYGYDFNSFNAAIENVKVLRAGGHKPSPIKIVLATDITVTASVMIDTTAAQGGLEIDGGFHKITLATDIPLFDIESDYITLRNIYVDCNIAASTAACFAKIGEDSIVEKITIENCEFSSVSGSTAAYFIRCGNLAGTNYVSDLYVNNNYAVVKTAAISFIKLVATVAESLISSTIVNNRFLQSPLSSSSEDCVRVAGNCKVDNNKIWGYFNSGVSIEFGNKTIVSNNWIFGGDSYPGTSANLVNGVLIRGNNTTPNNCVIYGNIIAGVTTYGIDANLAGINLEISNNIIENDNTPGASMTGIRGVSDTSIDGNFISSPGVYGVVGYNITNNYIYGGFPGAPTATGAIQALSNNFVSGNIVFDVDGVGIAPNYDSIISGNILYAGSAVTTAAINDCGSRTIITGNFVNGYGTISTSGSGVKVLSGGQDNIQISSNIFYNCIDDIIEMAVATNCLIGDNLITCTANSEDVIKNTGDDTFITGNLISSLSSVSAYAIWVAGDNNVVSGNALINCAGYGIYFQNQEYCICSNNAMIGSGGLEAIYLFGTGSMISDNYIYNYSSSSSTTAIKASASVSDLTIVGNMIKFCNGFGIDCNSSSTVMVLSNYLDGDTNSASGIIGVSQQSNVSDNIISNYGGIASSNGIETVGGMVIVSNNFITNIRSNLEVGIFLANGTYYNVIGNIIGDDSTYITKSGIYLDDSSYSLITNNVIIGNKSGVANDDGIAQIGFRNIISNNQIISSNYNGISFFSSQNLCCGNYIYDCDNDGIYVDSSGVKCKIFGNYIYTIGNIGVNLVGGCDNSEVNDNYIISSVGDGIYAATSDYINISGNYIFTPTVYGVELLTCVSFLIANNYIYQPDGGIYVNTASINGKISGNYIYDTQSSSSIYVVGGSNNVLVSNNYLDTSSDAGIVGGSSSNLSICNNYIYDVFTSSVYLDTCNHSLVSSNYMNRMVQYGVYVLTSTFVSINGNKVYAGGSDWGGILVYTTCNGVNICNNSIYYGARSGISISSNYYVISGNFIYNSGSAAYAQLDARDTTDGVVIGNNVAYTSLLTVDGIDVGGASAVGILLVGNRSTSGAGADSFLYSGSSDYLFSGNMARGSNNPAAWGTLPYLSTSNRYSS